MIKFTSNNLHDFQCESVSLLRDAGRDLTKRAGAKELLKYAKTPNQEDLHIIAVGSYEGTGFNRNGDAFLEDDCIKNHGYFTKSGRAVHRHHKNKPKDPKFGNIKAAAYNKKMRRIELVVGLDKDKCSDILHEQEKTGNTNWSMASKQAKDICSWCNHHAKTDKDRCEHIPSQIGEINKEGEMCGMVNPDPHWFEISYVRRPADRIGMSLGKVASELTYKPMTSSDYLNIYGDLYIPDDVMLSKKASDKRELLVKLAEIEKHVDMVASSKPITSRDKYIKEHAHKIKHTEKLSDETIESLRGMEPSLVLKTLADHGIVFSPEDFSRYLFDKKVKPERVDGMKTHLPSIFNSLLDNDGGKAVNDEKFEPSFLGKIPDMLKKLVGGLTESHSLHEGPVVRRIMMISIGGGLKPKYQEVSKEACDLEFAKQYAIYKLAALNYINERGELTEDLMLNSVLQNR
jgi:hypothetical protein